MFRWRKRPSAIVLHFSVFTAAGLARPLAIRSSNPPLSIGARHPVIAVGGSILIVALMDSSLCCTGQTGQS